jgi:predicted homoserine dehydrogenase-like protein
MSGGLRLMQDVTVGMRLTEEVMEIPRDSLLWRLRREQDTLFATHSP